MARRVEMKRAVVASVSSPPTLNACRRKKVVRPAILPTLPILPHGIQISIRWAGPLKGWPGYCLRYTIGLILMTIICPLTDSRVHFDHVFFGEIAEGSMIGGVVGRSNEEGF